MYKKTNETNSDMFKVLSIKERMVFRQFRELVGDFCILKESRIDSKTIWDVCYFSAGTYCIAEIKLRDWDSTYYSEGWLIEEQKYNNLLEVQKQARVATKVMYINVFRDGIAFWNLNDINPTFKERMMAKNSVDQYEKKVPKSSAVLPINESTFYKYDTQLNTYQEKAETVFEYIYKNPLNIYGCK